MRFKKVYIEILNSCNLQCSFCIQNQRMPKMMDIEQFQHIINEIKPYTNYVYLHVLGEPLLHPNLVEFLNICAKEGIQVNLTTNGTLIKNRIEDLVTCSIRQINISLHSYSQHHQKNYLKDIVDSVKKLEDNTFISYRLWSMRNGILDEDSQAMLNELCEHYHVEAKNSNKSMKLGQHVYLNFDEVFEWPSLQHSLVSNVGSCRGFVDMCAILVDGTVVPCCLDSLGDVTLGNIFTSSFSDILNTKKATAFLEGMKARKLQEELCQKCGYRTRFDRGDL